MNAERVAYGFFCVGLPLVMTVLLGLMAHASFLAGHEAVGHAFMGLSVLMGLFTGVSAGCAPGGKEDG